MTEANKITVAPLTRREKLKRWIRPIVKKAAGLFRKVWGVIAALVAGILLLIGFWDTIANKVNPPTEKKPPPVSIAPTERIAGTEFEHSDLQATLPYGYVIFSFKENSRFSFEPFPSDKVVWDVDWREVKIEPDFGKETVTWTLPPEFKLTEPDGRPVAHFEGGVVKTTFPIAPGVFRPMGSIYIKDEPMMLGGVLSANQRYPVYVLGFRILTESEAKKFWPGL